MSWVEELFDSGLYEREYLPYFTDEERAEEEADFLARALDLGPDDVVLDLACGSGRHAFALADRVKRVVGFDRTARLLDRARETLVGGGFENVEFVEGDMRELDYEGGFDAVYNYFTAWGYYSREENQQVLERVRRALVPGGRFLLETLSRPGLLRRFQPRSWAETPDGTLVLMEHEFDLETGRIRSRRSYRKGEEQHSLELDHELPAPDDLVRRFRDAGFGDVRLMSAPDGGELTLRSFRLAVVGTT
jgi:ubiquinone/menaquinone biosynthesis C-methylase UbiE